MASKRETGWLIERFADGFMPAYIGLDTDEAPFIFRFVEDSNRALRFARKIDAEHAMRQFEHLWRAILFNGKRCTVIATEHEWCAGDEAEVTHESS